MNKNNSQFNDKATLQSQVFAPPPAYHSNSSSPYYKSCEIRFSYHMFGPHMGGLHLDAHEINPRIRRRFKPIWQIYGDQGNMWHSISKPLPDINYLYYLSFTALRGRRYIGDIALDDISLSPECIGLRVPVSELRGYHYEALLQKLQEDRKNDVPQIDPSNITKYEFTNCNNTGRFGPTQQQCTDAYKNTLLNNSVKVLTDSTGTSSTGIQVWTIPQTRHYTLIAKGASGGRGAESNQMTSHGSIVKVTLLLRQGEKLYMLVGQEGASVCDQNVTLPDKIRDACGSVGTNATSLGRVIRAPKNRNAFVDLIQMNKLLGGGGGGGGGTFIWKMDGKNQIPLLVAAGGGGLAYNASSTMLPYGRGFNITLEPQSGSTQPNGAGGGGGWRGPKVRFILEGLTVMSSRLGTQKDRFRDTDDENTTMWIAAGESVIDGGGLGGVPCIDSIKWGANGGFGGGGGGCTAGGAGGGYVVDQSIGERRAINGI
ncbi:unnamed protein product [Allacma fusca]|uniref:receptor protein-tyrosine kinase n=1 Tax=Allacma fusca TaxID=39272 RepID=A0A8J2PLC3_9HEXA|nr:unnamed protein product [Allacma fusca]